MYLRKLSVANFKNIHESEIEFSPRLNCLIGDNGAGKTNLLDAVYFLSFTKSYFNSIDQLNVCYDETWFMLNGYYERLDSPEHIVCSYHLNQKKQIRRNTKTYRRMSDHIGLLPLVIVSPNDSVLITGGSDERRKFMDSVISQYDPGYLEDLIRYNRALLQRNNLLKQPGPGLHPDMDMLDVYDEQLIDSGERIHRKRNEFIQQMIPVFQKFYTSISRGAEEVGLVYQSMLLDGEFRDLLKSSYPADCKAQFTTAGIHKDDLDLGLGHFPIRKTGSQGQQKTFLVALKLAQFEFIRNVSGIKPILLLDDIFDKLDKNRVEQIVKMVTGEQFGQIFITDTNREHLDAILHSVASSYAIYEVENGLIKNLR